ncbi:TraB/GumN family protein [Cognatiluteimonas telluris]|jgi:uncharacterized protein YbaP (TraB family)|uniref:TraB/GumN family protein n=1 Tax=Cognatiluteimonas telluris TaxID=1104775 RepID=UPI00140E48C1|nr:TraB/GumN family protein [Lysobacter telluris]
MRLTRSVAGAVLAVLLSAAATGVRAEPPVPLLWKVSDADNSVYLLGSFHLLKPGDYPLSGDVDAAFDDAESVVFEIPPDEMGSSTLALQMSQAALRTDGTRLDDELPAAIATRLQAWVDAHAANLQAMGMPAQSLQAFEPWFVGLAISMVQMGAAGLDPRLGLDQHFAAEASAHGKPMSGLETGAQQIAFLDGMDRDEQVQFLAESLDASSQASDLERLHRAWRNGDAAALWDGMAADMKREYPRLYARIDVARNDAWVPRIEQRLLAPGKDDTLVVVGALHLLGSDGVVEKLRARGYRVERICSACTPRQP